MEGSFDVVTGAFGYSGRSIAERLLAEGRSVRTLTGDPARASPFGGRVEAHPFSFAEPGRLVESLRGAATLYNTYWVRFPHGGRGFEQAVDNTRTLFAAAAEAGVERVVHVSITNADARSALPYFRWKGVLERDLRESGLSHAVVRPTVLFGRGDVLVNNIAWLLRRLPVFVVPGRGDYRLQPVHVDDLARICVEAAGRAEDVVLDAVGPETYTFEALVRVVRDAVGSKARLAHAPPELALALGGVVGRLVRDVVLTRDELAGLSASLLVSEAAPTGTTGFGAWLEAHGHALGRRYASELARHYR
jgi:uncharacterized protein YbjT (DUF2867 family)